MVVQSKTKSVQRIFLVFTANQVKYMVVTPVILERIS